MGADAPSNAAVLRTVGGLQAAIRDLAPGACVGLPCGWRTAKSGHTLFLTVERPAAGGPDARDVHVSNCGPGLQYHPAEHGGAYPTSRQVVVQHLAPPPSRFACLFANGSAFFCHLHPPVSGACCL